MIIVRIWEGLGNQMFQYAYARKRMAEGVPVFLDLDKAYNESFPMFRNNVHRNNSIQKYNITVPSIKVEEYGKYFYLRRQTGMEKQICFLAEHGWWPYIFLEEKQEFYNKKVAYIKGNVYIKGWFQDKRYFEGIRKELLQEFTPIKKINISSEVLRMVKNGNSVALHIRRGDYVRLGRALPVKYYLYAKRLVEQKIAKPTFFVFSDDYLWVKENIPFRESDKVFYIDEICKLKDYEQLFLMSRCYAQIISNSTFSWWAAWLNRAQNKIVVMPRRFVQMNPGLEISNSFII